MWIFFLLESAGVEKTQDQSFIASGTSSFFLSEVRGVRKISFLFSSRHTGGCRDRVFVMVELSQVIII